MILFIDMVPRSGKYKVHCLFYCTSYLIPKKFYRTNWTEVETGKTGRIILKAKKTTTVKYIRLQMAETNKFPVTADRLIVKVRDNMAGSTGKNS